ncbi:RNA polymerase sigma factor [Streptomyces sp. cg40]|uniref:RNA polymerase sigma factor n=1 Tax=Streptomyces sp. cg40 TaxID=3419764 RepID=UPI003D0435EE
MRSGRAENDVDGRQWHSTIEAAQAGDRRALDELVAGWLPLVYNVVGRALNGHADVDDVVQETMLRAVDHLGSLRDPDSFRSWLVAIAMRQIRDRARRRKSPDQLPDGLPGDAADFAELTVLRLQLEGQRREVAEAVRWLDDEDRQLLSLWWLEVGGELTRRELAAAVGISRQHAAVRVQRMKERLETARAIVRALDGACPELREVTARRDGRQDSVWRKRVARHLRGCSYCGDPRESVVPAERLLVGIALVPLPIGFTLSLAFGAKTAAAAAGAAFAAGASGLGGVSGAVGVTGSAGAAGAAGAVGAGGSVGAAGFAGPAGAAGTAGFAGSAGASGVAGAGGTAGAAGAAGAAASAHAVGAVGAAGTAGASGAAHAVGTVGAAGASGVAGTTGFAGGAGSAGGAGASGVAGSAGASGSAGLAGASGAAHAAGTVGAAGASGVAGSTGLSGVAGAAGSAGGAGVSGSAGVAGSAGAVHGAGAVGSAGVAGAAGSAGSAAGAAGAAGSAGSAAGAAGTVGLAGGAVGWPAKVLGLLTKPAVAVTAGATIAAGGVYVATHTPDSPPPRALTPTASAGTLHPSSATATATTAPPSPSLSPSPSSRTTGGPYGSVVDAVDRAPNPDTPPAALPHRPASGLTSTGGAHATMNHRGDNVTLSGQGYVLVRWQVSPQYRSGALVMPSWTALKGKLFHVASGGGRRMDDPVSTTDPTATGMGSKTTGYDVLPTGTQQMWQNEYFYVDGSVTLTVNERGADYGLNVFPTTWDAVEQDITTGPAQGATRYGLTRDTGKDDAPVPQYVTRTTPADPATVAQVSRV